jgi:UDP-glucose 4-epimerase
MPSNVTNTEPRIRACERSSLRVSVERPSLDAEVNVVGTVRVLEAAVSRDVPVVFSSTGGAIYGEYDRPAPETAEREPF